MDSNVANQFIIALSDVFKQIGNVQLKKEKLEYFPKGLKVNAGVATIMGVTGEFKGQFVIAIDEVMATKIAEGILMGVPCPEYGEVAESAVCELGNMVGGAVSRLLLELGYTCDITVPSIVRGEKMEISFYPAAPMFVINFSCDWGLVKLILKFKS